MFGFMGGNSSWHFFHQSFYLLLTPLFPFPSTGFIKHAQWAADCSEILRWSWRGLSQRSRGAGGRRWDGAGTRRTAHPGVGAPARPLWTILCRHLGCLLLCHKGGQGQNEGFVLQVALEVLNVHSPVVPVPVTSTRVCSCCVTCDHPVHWKHLEADAASQMSVLLVRSWRPEWKNSCYSCK